MPRLVLANFAVTFINGEVQIEGEIQTNTFPKDELKGMMNSVLESLTAIKADNLEKDIMIQGNIISGSRKIE